MRDIPDDSRSIYYKTLDYTISKRDQENTRITNKMIDIHNGSKTALWSS